MTASGWPFFRVPALPPKLLDSFRQPFRWPRATSPSSSRFRRISGPRTSDLYGTSDVVGVEFGGALKNVIAIAAGVAEGMALGHNALAGLITRGLAEITRLACARGAQRETLAGLSGLGRPGIDLHGIAESQPARRD